MSEFDHAGHAHSRVGRTTVVYTVRRSSAGMPDRFSCSSRNSLLPAFRVISYMSNYIMLQFDMHNMLGRQLILQ